MLLVFQHYAGSTFQSHFSQLTLNFLWKDSAMIKKCYLQKSASVLVLLLLPVLASAQITITQSDFLGLIGTRQVSLSDQREDSIQVNVGSAGENQVWDLRSVQIVDTIFVETLFLNPADLSNAATFPGANLAERTYFKNIVDGLVGEFWLTKFYDVQSMYFIELGDSIFVKGNGADTTMISFSQDTISTMPVTYGDEWVTVVQDTFGFYPAVGTIAIEETSSLIDGWGTLKLPMGDFECLRVREIIRETSQSIINGMVTSTSSDSSINFIWVSKDNFVLASVSSQPGVTDPNFTLATQFTRLDSSNAMTTGIADAQTKLPESPQLLSNYPNPFNPETRVQFTVQKSGPVTVQVYDLNGRWVTTLFQGTATAGANETVWNGLDARGRVAPSGIYFLRMKTADGALYQHKMLLAK